VRDDAEVNGRIRRWLHGQGQRNDGKPKLTSYVTPEVHETFAPGSLPDRVVAAPQRPHVPTDMVR